MSLKYLDTLRQLSKSDTIKVAQQGVNIAQTATDTAVKALWWIKVFVVSFVVSFTAVFCALIFF